MFPGWTKLGLMMAFMALENHGGHFLHYFLTFLEKIMN